MDNLGKKKIKEIKPRTKPKIIATVAILSGVLIGAVALATNLTGALKTQNLSENNVIAENLNNVSTSTSDNLPTLFSNIPQNIENVQTASGNTFVAYLRSDGTVWAWGNNQYGQLGNGKIENVNVPEINQVLGENGVGHLENIKQITAGAYFMGALANDGRVLTWGYNTYGQLGNKSTASSATPVYVVDEFGEQIKNIKYISAGSSHMMALTESGEVWAWGLNNYGQLGINVTGNKTFAVKVQKLVVAEDGTVTTELENMNTIKQVSGGTDFSLALTEDGDVYAWGLGTTGQLATADKKIKYIAQKVAISNVTKIDAGGMQAIALKNDGTVWGWGQNTVGNLGIASSSSTDVKTAPVQVVLAKDNPLTKAVNISSLYQTSYALTEEGILYGWGLNTSGQIGDNTIANKIVATRVAKNAGDELSNIKVLPDGQHTHTNLIADKDGYLYVSGIAKNGQLATKQDSNLYQARAIDETYLELSNNQEYLEVGNTIKLNVSYHNGLSAIGTQKVATNVSYRSSNEDIATVDNSGNVTAIKRGYVTIVAENLDNGDIAESQINVVSKGATAIPMAHSGKTFSVMLKEDGTVWTVGNGSVGELGNGSTIIISEPTQVKIDANTYLTDIVKVSAGAQHALALKKDGSVWAWGEGANGRLGTGNATDMRYATQVKNPNGDGFLENVIDISVGYDFSIALTKDKTVYGWGVSDYNQLGVNSASDRTLPIKMNNAYNVIQIQAGRDSSLLLKGDGTVWGTGLNTSGQIGDNTKINRTELVPTINKDKNASLKGIVRITFGGHHMVALNIDKTAVTWGYNASGQLGNNLTGNMLAPIDLSGPKNTGIMENILQIGAGQQSTYIGTEDGNVYATGLNTNGELSINSKSTSKVFVNVKDETVNDLTGLGFLGIGRETTYAFVFDDGSVGITGVGTSGQRGDGTLVSSQTITKIKGGKIYTDKTYEIGVGATEKINVYLKPDFNLNLNNEDKLTNDNLDFESLNEEIATVTSDGVVRGISTGTTGIKITDTLNDLEGVAYIIVGPRDLSDTSKIVSGENFVALLKQDGTVWTWGNNTYGQLGNGKAENVNVTEPVQVLGIGGSGYLNDIIDISAGQYFVVALRRNGEVVTWGRNEIGELGTTVDIATTPMNVREKSGNILVGAVKVTAGKLNGAALKADGTVWVWGSNANSQLGQGNKINSTYAIPVLAPIGTTYLNNIKDIQAGNNFFISLTNDGEIYSWGIGGSGQLGNGATSEKNIAVKAKDLANIQKIAVGNDFVIALISDGRVYTWGYGGAGRLGNGSTSNQSSPVQVKLNASTFLTDVVDIGAIYSSGYALASDGSVYAWGAGAEGQLGNDASSNSSYPVKMVRIYKEELEKDILKLQSSSPASVSNFIIKGNGSILGNGRSTSGQMGYVTTYMARIEDILHTYLEIPDRISYIKQGESKKLNVRVEANLNANGSNITDVGNITWESTNPDIATVDTSGNVEAKETGVTTIIATEDKWGYIAQARVYVTSNTEKSITAPMIVQGTSFTAVLRADGTVWTTGLNTSGQLGLGDKAYRGEFERVKIDANTYLENVTRISAGANHMLAVTKDGFVYAWGLGTSGQLGQGNTNNYEYAVRVKDETGTNDLSSIIDVSAGNAHSLALTKDGLVYAFGSGANYRLGNLATANQTLPVRVIHGYDIVEMSAGNAHTAILRGDGFVITFGNSASGQTGIKGETADRIIPSEMMDFAEDKRMRNLISVRTGATNTMVLTREGKVYFTGVNTNGQLSQGNVTSPVARLTSAKILNSEGETVDLDNVASISSGNTYSIAVTKGNEAYACGLNSSGQLGLGDKVTPQNIFVKIKSPDGEDTLKNIDYIANGEGSTINGAAITKDRKSLYLGCICFWTIR